MEDFKIERRYLKFYCEIRAFIRCMKAAFYRPDFQKFRWLKDLGEHLPENTRPSLWNTHPSIWKFKKKLKAWPRVWKALPRVCITRRLMLSQSATVIGLSCLRGCLCEFSFWGNFFLTIRCLFNNCLRWLARLI